MLLSLASTLNSVPLPPVSNRYGIRLPPPEHCLTNVNFAIVPDPPPKPEFGDSVIQPPVVGQSVAQPDVSANDVEDTSMGEADTGESRGVKRTLDEDEDYD